MIRGHEVSHDTYAIDKLRPLPRYAARDEHVDSDQYVTGSTNPSLTILARATDAQASQTEREDSRPDSQPNDMQAHLHYEQAFCTWLPSLVLLIGSRHVDV